jgi:hypothetical protein
MSDKMGFSHTEPIDDESVLARIATKRDSDIHFFDTLKNFNRLASYLSEKNLEDRRIHFLMQSMHSSLFRLRGCIDELEKAREPNHIHSGGCI